jgi:hypothetical protein
LTATGDRQAEPGAAPGDERYIPKAWSSNEAAGKSGVFNLGEGGYTSAYAPDAAGSYTVTVTFRKQKWTGGVW